MKQLLSSFLVLTIISLSSVKAQNQQMTSNLTVEISQFRNTDGHLLISLFNKGEGFPEDKKGAFRIQKVKVKAATEKVVFEDLPYGEYALIFLHDENDSEDMDTNMMGIPQEGYGASNNAVNTFSAPKYKDAKFSVNQPSTNQTIKIYY